MVDVAQGCSGDDHHAVILVGRAEEAGRRWRPSVEGSIEEIRKRRVTAAGFTVGEYSQVWIPYREMGGSEGAQRSTKARVRG